MVGCSQPVPGSPPAPQLWRGASLSSYTKLSNWDKVIFHCDDCLKLDPDTVKALFRRATALEKKGEIDKAGADVKRAAALAPDDKAIRKLGDRIKALQKRQKDKERKMAARMFG